MSLRPKSIPGAAAFARRPELGKPGPYPPSGGFGDYRSLLNRLKPVPALLGAFLLLWAGATASIAAAPAFRYTTHDLPELGLSLELPAHWRAEPPGQKGARALVFSGPPGGEDFPATLSLQATARRPGRPLALTAAELESQWKSLPGYEMLEREPGSLDGAPGLRLLIRHRHPQNPAAGYGRESVIVERGCCIYFISYTAPESIFTRYRPVLLRALDTLRFGSKAPGPGGAPPDPGRGELLEAAAFGPAALPLWAGPLYSPSWDDGSPLGAEIAGTHARLVGDLARLLARLGKSQADLLPLLDQLTPIYLEQASLLEKGLPDPGGGPDRRRQGRELLARHLDFVQIQAAQRGMAEESARGLPGPDRISSSLEAIDALTAWQQALSDQQALILTQLDQALIPSLLLHAALTAPSSGLGDHERLRLAQFNRREQELMSRVLAGINQTAQYTARLNMLLDLLADFQLQAARAYAGRLAEALPGLKSQVERLRAAGRSEAAELLALSLAQLEAALQNTAAAHAPARPGLWAGIWEFILPQAHARRSLWELGRDFVGMSGVLAYGMAKTAVVDVPRVMASGVRALAGHVELGSTRLAQELSYTAYRPLGVATPAAEIIGDPRDIKDPKWQGKEALLARKLEELKRRHDAGNLASYRSLKNQVTDKAWQEYRRGEWGVSALKQGAADAEDFSAKQVPGAVKAIMQAPARLVLGEKAGDRAGAAAAYIPGVVLAVAGKTVSDIPKSVMVLCNNRASWADQGKAYYDLAGTFGASALAFKGTALAAGRKIAPHAAAAFKKGSQLLAKVIPARGAAAQAVQKLGAPAVQKVSALAVRGAEKAAALDSRMLEWAGKKLLGKMDQVAALARGGLGKTLGRETAAMLTQVGRNLAYKGNPLQVLQRFAAENLTLQGLKQNALNDTFSDKVLHPMLKLAESFLNRPPPPPSRPPASSGSEGVFANDNLTRKDKGKIEGSFKADNLNRPRPSPPSSSPAASGTAKKDRDKELARKARQAEQTMQGQETAPPPPDRGIPVIPTDCAIEAVSWSSASPEFKNKEVFYVRGQEVSGETNATHNTEKYHTADWRCEPSRYSGVFKGALVDNVIRGTWKMKQHRHTCTSFWRRGIKDGSGKYSYSRVRCDYSFWGSYELEVVITLNLDKSLRSTYSGRHTSHTQYGPDCWEKMANTTKTHTSTFSWDDPKMPEQYRNKPVIGIWRFRGKQENKP